MVYLFVFGTVPYAEEDDGLLPIPKRSIGGYQSIVSIFVWFGRLRTQSCGMGGFLFLILRLGFRGLWVG
jgi:hypothetical protein